MLNDYQEEPEIEEEMEEEKEEVEEEIEEEILECENDTRLEWDCDDLHPGHGSTCSKQCPNGNGGVAHRKCHCKDGQCSWEYKMPSIDCLVSVTDHHRQANKVLIKNFVHI